MSVSQAAQLSNTLRRLALVTALGVTAGACSSTPPNILLISLDATRADHLSPYGYSRETSPFLAELASRGVRFSNAFVNTHGTVPSHVSILSSEYAQSHRALGVPRLGWSQAVPESVVLLPELLKREGYATLAVTDGGWMSATKGFDRGFEDVVQAKGIVSGTSGLIAAIALYALDPKPIFALFYIHEIHSPYAPPEAYQKQFGEFSSAFVPSTENLIPVMHDSSKLSEADLARTVAMYDGEIRFTDDTLRAFWKQLELTGFLENSLVIITSDHGEEFADHGGMLHRAQLYDELLHVPLIILGTGVPAGVVDDRMASSVDIVPTIFGRLGQRRAPRWSGTNLLAPSTVPPADQAVFQVRGRSVQRPNAGVEAGDITTRRPRALRYEARSA